MKRIHVIGGGTVFHVRPHLALSAPAYGKLAQQIEEDLEALVDPQRFQVDLHLTKMADPNSRIETNADVAKLVDRLIDDPDTKAIFLTAALCDFEGHVGEIADHRYEPIQQGTFVAEPSGKDRPRLKSNTPHLMQLTAAEKILPRIRRKRKDIFLIACKTTAGATSDEQFVAGLDLLKRNSCNLVLANDVLTRNNMIITPEEARYSEGGVREMVVEDLVEMAYRRMQGTFTRSTVVDGDPVPWGSEAVPESLRAVVNYCISRGAYKPFNGATVGHFAVKVDNTTFLTSRRKTDFNDLDKNGLVLVTSNGPDSVIARGARPSVGGQSQRIIFAEHPDVDCIVHFHCPLKPGREVPVRPQRNHECGSHECGRNTSEGLRQFQRHGHKLWAVMLDEHGPNIVFNRNVPAKVVIDFIEENFDLLQKTDGILRPTPDPEHDDLLRMAALEDALGALPPGGASGGPGRRAAPAG